MDVAIVYESTFGNTRSIAEAIAEGMRAGNPGATVSIHAVADAAPDEISRTDLLVVGGPTHLRGMSTPSSRRRARRRAIAAGVDVGVGVGDCDGDGAGTPGIDAPSGVREWLKTLPRASGAQPAATFDTRLPAVLAGGAAPRIARLLEGSGYRMMARPEHFQVVGTEPLLRAGERERAMAWGDELITRLVQGHAR